jgi:F0F1-type ATP synthase membrane subunit a
VLSRRNGIILGVLVVIVVGFALVKTPRPVISIAAEDVLDLGGYTVTNTILSAWVVIILMAALTFKLYRRLRNVEEALVPHGFQNVIEALMEAFFDVVKLIAGERGARRFFPVVATIFIFLLFANWFGLLPINNVIGNIEDVRVEYLEELEENGEDVFADLGVASLSVGAVNDAFATFYLDPIPLEASEQDEANARIDAIRGGEVSEREAAVRQEFAEDPIPRDIEAAELAEAIEERLGVALAAHPFSEDELHLIHADDAVAGLEKAAVFNLPLPSSQVDETELEGAIVNSGGANIVPIKAENFEYSPYVETTFLDFNSNGGFVGAHIFDPSEGEDDENQPRASGEVAAPVTVNLAHVGLMIQRDKEGLSDSEGIGEIFPWFRSIATDLNLPLAIALWSFIFVQIWGVQSLGAGGNFGRFIGVGKAAVVKGPIGVMVGLLEIVSELARIVSFTFRLFGNIIAGEILLFMAAFLVPFLAATVFYGLEVFVGFIQAFVFAMLTLVFAVTTVSHGEHDEEHEEAGGHEA